MNQHLTDPSWTLKKLSSIYCIRELAEIFVHEVWLSADSSRKVIKWALVNRIFLFFLTNLRLYWSPIELLSKFSFISSIRHFKNEILTYRGIPKLFLKNNPRKVLTFRSYLPERLVFPQLNLCKIVTFRGLSCGKFSYFFFRLRYLIKWGNFPSYNPRKILTFYGLSYGKANLSAV
jgi:hypothetical protein